MVLVFDMLCFICLFDLMTKATSPQTGGQQTGGTLKSLKDKDKDKTEKDTPDSSSGLKIAGPDGEIAAGLRRRTISVSGLVSIQLVV